MDPADFVAKYPTLLRLADVRSWPSIERHGLLSAAEIVRRWQVSCPAGGRSRPTSGPPRSSRQECTTPGSGALAGNTRLMDRQEVLRAVACPAADVARSMFRLSTTSIRAWKNQTTGGKIQ